MLNNISWGSYWSALTVLLFFYYAYLLLRYYRKDIAGRLAITPRIQLDKEIEDGTPSTIIQAINDEIIAYLEQASHERTMKQELVFALRKIALKYKSVRNSQYLSAINNLIHVECGNKCGIHLSEEEIRQVWMD